MPEIRIRPIKNGTVIDHISGGNALRVLRILGIKGPELESTASVVMMVPSASMGKKDILKLEDKELKKEEVDKTALISPDATINIIREEQVVSKSKVTLPDTVVGILKCSNPNCITNRENEVTKEGEPVQTEYEVVGRAPVKLKCNFCERVQEDLENHLL